MFWKMILLALRDIRRNVMRSVLTVLGIIIGVAAVITLVTVGNGTTTQVTDQIVDRHDRCPELAEDIDGFEDEDGCPDPDNDGDGVPDLQDDCPDDAEDRDGFQDVSGPEFI